MLEMDDLWFFSRGWHRPSTKQCISLIHGAQLYLHSLSRPLLRTQAEAVFSTEQCQLLQTEEHFVFNLSQRKCNYNFSPVSATYSTFLSVSISPCLLPLLFSFIFAFFCSSYELERLLWCSHKELRFRPLLARMGLGGGGGNNGGGCEVWWWGYCKSCFLSLIAVVSISNAERKRTKQHYSPFI